jgi:hypothetical protein
LARKVLSNIGIPFEQVSSSNLLTNFRPRESNKHSLNCLRLVKRDPKQFLRVVPIEDHSNLVGSEHTVHITRLYVKNGPSKDGESLFAKAQKALNSAFDD